jgi:hypothetical protein
LRSKLHCKPSQAKPSQAKPSQAKPSQAKPSQNKQCAQAADGGWFPTAGSAHDEIIAPCIGNRKRSNEYGDSGIKSTLDISRLLPIDLQD